MIKSWRIVAFPDPEEGLQKKEIIVQAFGRYEAMDKGWRTFPEYHEIGVYEIKENWYGWVY